MEKMSRKGNGEVLLTWNGVTHNLTTWSKITGIAKTTISSRLKKGWDANRVLEKNVKYQIDDSKEEWRPVAGYEGLYEVSRNGHIKSLPKYNREARFLKPTLNKRQGRYSVMLSKNGKRKRVSVHRVVATAFVYNPNPEVFTEINHKDENPANNKADNLEWCDRWYNMHYNDLQRRITHRTIPIVRIDKDGNKKYYRAVRQAKKDGFDTSGIYASIKKPLKSGGKRKYKGFYWEYANGTNEQK